jgi:hypothetical protein
VLWRQPIRRSFQDLLGSSLRFEARKANHFAVASICFSTTETVTLSTGTGIIKKLSLRVAVA